MWHWREKPSISSFLKKKIRVHDWIKLSWVREEVRKNLAMVCLERPLEIAQFSSLSYQRSLRRSQLTFLCLPSAFRLGSRVKSSHRTIEPEKLSKVFLLSKLSASKLRQVFCHLASGVLFNHGTQTFQEKLEIEGVRVTSSVYCSMP